MYENEGYMPEDDYKPPMPGTGVATLWLVIGFVGGALWGALALTRYIRMRRAIKDGLAYEAIDNAKKVRMFALIGIAVNAVVILIQLARIM